MTSLTSIVVWLFLAAEPFWTAKPPMQWTDAELVQFLTDSPWSQMALGPGGNPPVLVFIATAGPMLQAEEERERRGKLKRRAAKLPEPPEDELAQEYRLWLDDNRPSQIVLAVRVPDARAFDDVKEVRRMEEESVMRVGRDKIKMTGHFPPTAADPYLRLAFPRKQIRADGKSLSFDLYVPGLAAPFRHAEFPLKDMVANGRSEY